MTSLTQNFLNPNNKPFVIGDFTIRQDEDGRYCLNDLHKASGDLAKHKPSNFLRNQQTQDLIAEVESFSNMRSSEDDRCSNLSIGQKAINVIKGGEKQGAYVVKELVYAYAMWISPKFHLMVIRAYDSLVMEWVLNGKQTISPEQAGILYNIVHTRANGNKNLIVQMWSRLKNHFKYSASYRELRAIHFEDAKHYLEVMDLTVKPEKHDHSDPISKLDDYLQNLASRFPTLQNPLAYEIASKIAEKMKYQDLKGLLNYWVSIENGKTIVHAYSVHHLPVNIVRLAKSFEPLKEFLVGNEIEIQARELAKIELKAVPM